MMGRFYLFDSKP